MDRKARLKLDQATTPLIELNTENMNTVNSTDTLTYFGTGMEFEPSLEENNF